MGILDRIKKKEYKGFKEFVGNLDSSPGFKRNEIMALGMIEDPIYMSWVVKNILTMDKFSKLSGDFFDTITKNNDTYIDVIAQSIHGTKYLDVFFESCFSAPLARLVKEALKTRIVVKADEQFKAQCILYREFRKLQERDEVGGIAWHLPPKEIFSLKDGLDVGVVEIKLENGKLCARGSVQNSKRTGPWSFFYETGSILGQGSFVRGQKQGVWTLYYPDGKNFLVGEFKDDERFGKWLIYDIKGGVSEKQYSAE